MRQEIQRQQTAPTVDTGGLFARGGMKRDPETGSGWYIQPLRQQRPKHAGQHIAHAAAGHAGMTMQTGIQLAIATDQRARTLE